ncbi:uncharacterized protein LOC122798819 [Protopterus annectens]|uniref:uncharacterized protein LOC122798819 n=1 Tax=Protopterus annectens TaxID=7888 RepID=UPI001CFB7C64|nr:uncharacterized protein LOC122798819 [Protopterus annectens]
MYLKMDPNKCRAADERAANIDAHAQHLVHLHREFEYLRHEIITKSKANKIMKLEDDERSTGKKRNKICNRQSNKEELRKLHNSRCKGRSLVKWCWRRLPRPGKVLGHQRQNQEKTEQCHSLQGGELNEQMVQKCKWSRKLLQRKIYIIQSEFSKRINRTDCWQRHYQGESAHSAIRENGEKHSNMDAIENDEKSKSIKFNRKNIKCESSENENKDPDTASCMLKSHSQEGIKHNGEQNGSQQTPHQDHQKNIPEETKDLPAKGHHSQTNSETNSTSGLCTAEGSTNTAAQTNYTRLSYELHSKQTTAYYRYHIENIQNLRLHPSRTSTDCAKEMSALPSSKSSDRK